MTDRKSKVVLPSSAAGWLEVIREADRQIGTAQEAKAKARAEIEALLGEAELGVLDGEVVVRWAHSAFSRLDVSKLREAEPDVYERFVVRGTVRRFSVADQ